jgi:hypothetical protein
VGAFSGKSQGAVKELRTKAGAGECSSVSFCGYRKFHILLIGVVAARKTHRVALSHESNPGLADRWQAQIMTAVHSGGFPTLGWGVVPVGSLQAARRS